MSDVDDKLSRFDKWSIPPATHAKTIDGSEVSVNLGIAGDFGGVGVTFELVNKSKPDQSVNILEARSATGCGWQTSFLFTDQSKDQIIVFNQAAGNSVAYQWGYQNDYDELAAFHWNPVVSDHTHPHRDFSHSIPTSPYDHNGYWLEDGRLHIGTNPIPSGSGERGRHHQSIHTPVTIRSVLGGVVCRTSVLPEQEGRQMSQPQGLPVRHLPEMDRRTDPTIRRLYRQARDV